MHQPSEEVAMNKPQRTDRQTGKASLRLFPVFLHLPCRQVNKIFPFHGLHRSKVAF